jgi:hypothetical protein
MLCGYWEIGSKSSFWLDDGIDLEEEHFLEARL